jgi:hypothetical protein
LNDSFYDEFERVFHKFPKCHITILLRNFNAKVGGEDIFKQTVGNENLHEIRNVNAVRVENFVTSKNLTVKNTMFSHPTIHEYT